MKTELIIVIKEKALRKSLAFTITIILIYKTKAFLREKYEKL